ncbi:hypothetical protein F5B20DRAFT_583404 [Whalleya microplaca]|nr:hypothetical protein F5B20DRAFT_583404 [Whalleya microplaca]
MDPVVAVLRFGLLWLLLFLSINLYFLDFRVSWESLIGFQENLGNLTQVPDPGRWTLGLCLLFLSAILKAHWVLPLIQILVTTWFCDRSWKPPTNSSRKRIMQADDSIWSFVQQPDSWVSYHEGRRPRRCPYSCDYDLSDRAYHCSHRSQCLPMYDHFCPWLQSDVYLRTLKQYCFVLAFLPLDGIYSIAVAIYTLTNPEQRLAAPFAASVIFSTSVVLYVGLYNSVPAFHRIVWCNALWPERRGDKWTLVFKVQHGNEWRLHAHKFDKNPYDLGPAANLRQLLGEHWWQWPFFWWSPQRVSRYGNYVDRDLPYADFVSKKYTELVMPDLTSVATDPPRPSPIPGQGPSRRQAARSSASRRTARGAVLKVIRAVAVEISEYCLLLAIGSAASNTLSKNTAAAPDNAPCRSPSLRREQSGTPFVQEHRSCSGKRTVPLA